ncbi:unnamed protein product [Blepharisma stoltei]|uniref:Uncharacterized protein n=1 Tax=Blepharisma stoltei TaxID=1481888 RepID=A0AAU9JXL7_9CILI|nr:unnamed protein product [Blepharisma stoltei]
MVTASHIGHKGVSGYKEPKKNIKKIKKKKEKKRIILWDIMNERHLWISMNVTKIKFMSQFKKFENKMSLEKNLSLKLSNKRHQ